MLSRYGHFPIVLESPRNASRVIELVLLDLENWSLFGDCPRRIAAMVIFPWITKWLDAP